MRTTVGFVTLTFVSLLDSAFGAGSINGSVTGADGSIIQAGLVTATLREITFPERPIGPKSGRAEIGPTGTFTISGLNDGTYILCVQTQRTTWLNPCEWGEKGAIVSLSQSGRGQTVSIVLTKGAIITIQVNDTSNYLNDEGKTPGVHLLIGVPTDAHFFQQAWVASQGSKGRVYQVLVPFDRLTRISVASAIFQLADTANLPLARMGNTLSVLVSTGRSAPIIVLNITGRD